MAYFEKMLALDPKDDSSHAEVGAWCLRTGQRDKGEALLAQALARRPHSPWEYLRAAESLLSGAAGQ